jgi:D-3-phosphoglycerate dehydrogenase
MKQLKQEIQKSEALAGTFLVNNSRGEVVSEPALIEVLKSHRINGTAADVFLKEPLPAGNPLTIMKNVILSPHCAGSTCESNVCITLTVAQIIPDLLEEKRSRNVYF